MKKLIMLFVVLIISAGGGYYFGYDRGFEAISTGTGTEKMTHEDDHSHTHHEQIEAPAPAPSATLTLHQENTGAWNAQITFENFTLAPEHASTADVPGEGHAHIYVDGEKINRVYGEWYHLGTLPAGTHEVSVRLSTNDHKELLSNGMFITATETIEVEEMREDSVEMSIH